MMKYKIVRKLPTTPMRLEQKRLIFNAQSKGFSFAAASTSVLDKMELGEPMKDQEMEVLAAILAGSANNQQAQDRIRSRDFKRAILALKEHEAQYVLEKLERSQANGRNPADYALN